MHGRGMLAAAEADSERLVCGLQDEVAAGRFGARFPIGDAHSWSRVVLIALTVSTLAVFSRQCELWRFLAADAKG